MNKVAWIFLIVDMNKDSLVHYAYEPTRPSAPTHRVPVGGRWKGVVRTIFHLRVIDRIAKKKVKFIGSALAYKYMKDH